MHHVNCIVAITSILFAEWLAKWSGKHNCRAGKNRRHIRCRGRSCGRVFRGGSDWLGDTEISRLPKTFASLDLRTGDFDYVRNLSFRFSVSVLGFEFCVRETGASFFLSWFLCKLLASRHAFWPKEKTSHTLTKPIHFAIGRQLFDVADAFGLDFGDGQVGGDLQNVAADWIVAH